MTSARATERPSALCELVNAAVSRPVSLSILALGEAARARHGEGVEAVLAYGSCLRGIDPRETLADLYVLTSSSADVSRSALSRLGCRLLPPNVYYLELPFEGLEFRAKYAVLPLSQFEEWVQPKTDNPYFWARFSQPSALLWTRDEPARERVIAGIACAITTMVGEARRLSPSGDAPAAWEAVLRETYATELRSEGGSRGRSIIAADNDWYEQVFSAAGASAPARGANWARRRRRGKLLAMLRLLKAAFTFQGGADYLAWKIERHSRVKVDLSPWQRRHPIIASLWLVPKLYRRGAFR
ncbi:hypothetical protein FHS85_003369 [Rhodoligotrophos appendicifer]|uniref:hypothetical protein n=1 Tax=Rhodoligotrophos appendicifer TaxID=987056 RepID=UPI001184FBF9|nr:hypothetical protein [Rhodoligotrophos appendicifer]